MCVWLRFDFAGTKNKRETGCLLGKDHYITLPVKQLRLILATTQLLLNIALLAALSVPTIFFISNIRGAPEGTVPFTVGFAQTL